MKRVYPRDKFKKEETMFLKTNNHKIDENPYPKYKNLIIGNSLYY